MSWYRTCSIIFFSLWFVIIDHFLSPVQIFGTTVPRTALIIGNGDYAVAPLKNPVNDARDIADVLKRQGFKVIHKENADRSLMRSSIREFEETLAKRGGTGLFYFAGHGVQLQGQNYLVPIGANINKEYEVSDETIQADLVLKAMAYANNDLNIVILDACRNNPYPRGFRSASRGLARMETMGSGMLIAYATAPGAVASDGDGENGIYTKHLLRAMQTPGLSIEQVFKSVRQNVMRETNRNQTPWEESSLTGDFYFIATDNAKITVLQSSQQLPSPGTSHDNKELTLWRGILNSRATGDYEKYLEKYPDGVFAELAKTRISILQQQSPDKESASANNSILKENIHGAWKLEYFENNKNNYLLFRFFQNGSGKAEGEEPDGTWWAEPIQWSLDGQLLTIKYEGREDSYTVEMSGNDTLVLLVIAGENKGDRFAMSKEVPGESKLSLNSQDPLLFGTWKETWEDEGGFAYEEITMNKDGSALKQGKSQDGKWSEACSWRVTNNNILTITSAEDKQEYEIVHIVHDYLDLIDLSVEYNGFGSRFVRIK